MRKVALLGTGAMGARIGIRLLAAGFELVVWNRDPARYRDLIKRGAIAAESPVAAAARVDVVMSMVSDDDAACEVWLDPQQGAIKALGPGAVAIESSSTTPEWSRRLDRAVCERGARLLEAPVVGSRPQADSGQLIYLCGGDPQLVEALTPVLSAAAAAVHRVGPIGSAMAAKLAVNNLFAAQVATLVETLSVLTRAGIDDDVAIALLAELPTTSPALKGIGALIAARRFEPLFPIDLVVKDLDYYARLAALIDTPVPIAALIGERFREAQRAGLGAANIAALAQLSL